jgi:hypothetical protein
MSLLSFYPGLQRFRTAGPDRCQEDPHQSIGIRKLRSFPGTFKNVNLMPECQVLKHQIPSLAKLGYDHSEYKPEIRCYHAPAWLFAVNKSSDFNPDEYLVGTRKVSNFSID